MHPLPRYQASRLAKLSGAAAISAALALPGLACSTSDEDAFDEIVVRSDTASADDASGIPATADTAIAPTEAATAEPTSTEAGPPAVASGQMVIDFTYTASDSGGRVRNPYIAVWIENPDGTLVRTVALWFEASGTRWLSDLSSWSRVSRAYVQTGGTDAVDVDVISGATQVPGAYSVLWDGTDEEGAPVPVGEYILVVESAREHGDHSVTSEAFTVGAAASVTLTDDGELSGLTASLVQ